MLPDGATAQTHVFTFENLGGGFYKGTHSWAIPAENLKSHDGKEFTYTAAEPFLGVVDLEGVLWLVENGDTTSFRLHLVDPRTIDFIGMEGGEHPVVGRGSLTRE